MQFSPYDAQDVIVPEFKYGLVATASEEAAQQGPIFGGTMRKLIVDESGGEHALAFAAGYEKTETGRQ